MHQRLLKILIAVAGAALVVANAQADPMAAPTADSADLLVVLKADRILYVYRDGLPIRSYPIQLGRNPRGPKLREGDRHTPEGAYTLDWRNPDSKFYRSIHITYPNPRDMAKAARQGVSPGGEIMIHGQPVYDSIPRHGDWTDGCIAVTDQAMDELWDLVPEATPIHIYP